MSEGAVMHDVIQLDRAVVGRAQPPSLLVFWQIRVNRRDDVIVNRESIERCRRAVEGGKYKCGAAWRVCSGIGT